ncbi:MAG: prepilin-type N-terminal cleavage/methylation domain-containing protein [Pseudomonadota bacterium]
MMWPMASVKQIAGDLFQARNGILCIQPVRKHPWGLHSTRGFTLLEIVAVLVLLGILTAVAMTGTTDLTDDAFKAGEPERAKAHLRYAQARAMSDQTGRYFIDFTGNSYCLKRYDFKTRACSTLPLPGEAGQTVTLQGGITLAVDRKIGFSGLGTPLSGSPGSMTDFTGALAFNGTDTSIKINKSGYIHLK